MTNRTFCLTAAGLLGGLAVGVAGLLGLVWHEPVWYAQAAVPAGPDRGAHCTEFSKELFELMNAISGEREWGAGFTAEQVNSYLAEGLAQSGLDGKLLPEGVSDPRVAFDQGGIRLGFRYGHGLWGTVVTIDLRLWLPDGEPNVVALEVVRVRAGALPVSAQPFLPRVEEKALENNIGLTWYRRDGNPVAVLRFNEDSPRTTLHLQAVQLKPGSVRIKGRTHEPTPLGGGAKVHQTLPAPNP